MLSEVFVHDRGLCESEDVGAGTRVWAFAHVMDGARVGRDCNICGGAFIESGAVLGDGVTVKNNVLVWDKVVVEDDCFLGPNAVFTNDFRPRAAIKKGHDGLLGTHVHQGATIGANATVVCGVRIGEHAFHPLRHSRTARDNSRDAISQAVKHRAEQVPPLKAP